jgi:hypothetical protein
MAGFVDVQAVLRVHNQPWSHAGIVSPTAEVRPPDAGPRG